MRSIKKNTNQKELLLKTEKIIIPHLIKCIGVIVEKLKTIDLYNKRLHLIVLHWRTIVGEVNIELWQLEIIQPSITNTFCVVMTSFASSQSNLLQITIQMLFHW